MNSHKENYKTKEQLIQMIIDYNFKDEGFTLDGVIRFLPKRVLQYGYLYGWDEPEVQHRIFIYMLNIKGFKQHLKGEIINGKVVDNL